MTRTRTVSDHVDVAAAPDEVYALLSDPGQIQRWSPENTGAVVHQPRSGGAYEGMTFVGRNKRGRANWSTRCVVTAADRGRRFAFRVEAIGPRTPILKAKNATWEYRFEPVEGGTRVTETWTDDRPWPDAVAAVFDKVVTGGRLFADFQRRNIATTLANLRDDLGAARP
ncbi:MAG: SRPBCC family protein [Rhodococcus sp. (in: high G+C Gram-positive bacteria)]